MPPKPLLLRYAGLAALAFFWLLPFMAAYNFGMASTGLSAGFALPIESGIHLLLLVALGLWLVALDQKAILVGPALFLATFFTAALLSLHMPELPLLKYSALTGGVLVGWLVKQLHSRALLIWAAVAASFAFQLGGHAMQMVPEMASPAHFLIGMTACLTLLFAIIICFGLSMMEHCWELLGRIRKSTAFGSFLSLFF